MFFFKPEKAVITPDVRDDVTTVITLPKGLYHIPYQGSYQLTAEFLNSISDGVVSYSPLETRMFSGSFLVLLDGRGPLTRTQVEKKNYVRAFPNPANLNDPMTMLPIETGDNIHLLSSPIAQPTDVVFGVPSIRNVVNPPTFVKCFIYKAIELGG
jgi:hypothetical protein